jgi:hypothetical protein
MGNSHPRNKNKSSNSRKASTNTRATNFPIFYPSKHIRVSRKAVLAVVAIVFFSDAATKVGERHVSINAPQDITSIKQKAKRKGLKMDESAHTFGPMAASVSSHYRGRGGSPVMITDALSDVRVNYHIDLKELGHGHYGVVRKCYNRETGACYAIKVRLCCSAIVVAIFSLAIHKN